MNKIKIISIITGIVLSAGTAVFMFRNTPGDGNKPSFFASLYDLMGSDSQDANLPSSPPSEWQDQQATASSENDVLADFTAYAHPELPFSFGYPKSMIQTAFEGEQGTEVLLFQGGGNEFQISIRPFDEPEPLTAQRIKRDLPTIYVDQPQQALIGPEKDIPALIFFSQDSAAGKTHGAQPGCRRRATGTPPHLR